MSTIQEHPYGAVAGAAELTEQEDMTIVATYGNVLIVDEQMPGGRNSRKEYIRRDDRPASFALNVDGQWYEFVRTIK